MPKPHKPSNFMLADQALHSGDAKTFSKAIASEVKRNPRAARDIVEISLLALAGQTGLFETPANRMLSNTVNALAKIAPLLSFNDQERALTMRVIAVAEATCTWGIQDRALTKVVHTKSLVEHMPMKRAFALSLSEGIIDQNGKGMIRAMKSSLTV